MEEARYEWVEHLVPFQFARALWDALFPTRFERQVLAGLDGTPLTGYARPVTFCLGCWLLLFASVQAFPWAFRANGIGAILTSLPPADRHVVTERLGLAHIEGAQIPDSGRISFGSGKFKVIATANDTVGKPFGWLTSSEVATYLEQHGDADLGLRVRGYASRLEDRPSLFSQTIFVLLVVFGLIPAWNISHRILASPIRTVRETRRVHMYNDGLLVVTFLIPFSLATWSGQAFGTHWPQRILLAITVVAFVTWGLRTLRLFRLTHGAPAWRTVLAHLAGVAMALVMFVVFSAAASTVVVLRMRVGL